MEKIIKTMLIMLFLDMIYLNLIAKSMYTEVVNNIQKSVINVRILPAIITYLIMTFALYYFIISQNKSENDAFILGFVIYGVFDFTNMAIFENYTLNVAIIDTLWGSILFYLTTKLLNIF